MAATANQPEQTKGVLNLVRFTDIELKFCMLEVEIYLE